MATFYYGGQAVMEGVMMRGRKTAAVAIRRPEGSIYLYEEILNPRLYQNKLFRLPFLRGMLLLWEMLVLGTRLMTLSANIATGAWYPDAFPPPQPHEATEDALPPVAPSAPETPQQGSFQIGGAAFIFTLIVSLSIAVAVFFVGPLLLTNLLHNQIGEGWLNLTVEGGIRLGRSEERRGGKECRWW